MEATVTIICGTILALGQAWIQFRLKQQDNTRDAAREEMKATAEKVKAVAVAEATKVKLAVDANDQKLDEIHVMVNSRLSDALDRVASLETKMGLSSGEEIPAPQIVTKGEAPDK